MTDVQTLIELVEAPGGWFVIDGDRLGIFPKDAAAPVLEELRQHKQAIIDLLSRRPQMPAGVRLIRWDPKAAPVRLSEYNVVTDVEGFIRTTLRELDNHLRELNNPQRRKKFILDGGWGLSGLLARLEAVGCYVVLENPRRTLQ